MVRHAKIVKIDGTPAPFLNEGGRLRAYREALGYQQALTFAEAAGINYNAYSMAEAGSRQLSLLHALALHRQFGISLDYIYFGRMEAVPFAIASKLQLRRT